jgi:DNA uptake protein ComE-like DNA-binding protein
MERLILWVSVIAALLGACQAEQESVVTLPEDIQPVQQKFDLNSVTRSELDSVEGLRSNVIDGILQFQKFPTFRRVEDLLAIKGIGEKTFLKIRKYFYVENQSSAGQ